MIVLKSNRLAVSIELPGNGENNTCDLIVPVL